MNADIKSMTINELESLVLELGEKGFRAKQIFSWLHQKHACIDDMTSLSKDFRERLKTNVMESRIMIVEKLISTDGTIKYLFDVGNNTIIESVLMRYDHGYSVCVSSQAGCRMGCKFCASAIGGLERNLTAGEIASQVYSISQDIGERISNVVVMGCGEPLDNYDALLRFIDIISSENGINIGQRHITVSTCGVADKIYTLADKRLQITLAVSLHAPNDNIRKTIMPIAGKYSMDVLLKACKYYADKTKRRITFEYALIEGVNDSREYAYELAKKIKNMLCHVNLIPVNNVRERGYEKSGGQAIKIFSHVLEDEGINATVRRSLGSDIEAACGQLRRRYLNLDT